MMEVRGVLISWETLVISSVFIRSDFSCFWAARATTSARVLRWLLKSAKHLLSKEDGRHHEVPQLNLTAGEARWFTLARVDSATVTTAGGTGVTFRKRDRDLAKRLWDETTALHKEIERDFDELRATYRAAQDRLTSREEWKKVFDAQ